MLLDFALLIILIVVIGSMLSKMCTFSSLEFLTYIAINIYTLLIVLVLGACFFAGGLRFTEQDFNAGQQAYS